MHQNCCGLLFKIGPVCSPASKHIGTLLLAWIEFSFDDLGSTLLNLKKNNLTHPVEIFDGVHFYLVPVTALII